MIMWRWWGLKVINDKVQITAFAEYRKRHLETGGLQTVKDGIVRNITKHIISKFYLFQRMHLFLSYTKIT